MSTQLQSSSEDLDRTDELPCLDVAAYEATLAQDEQGWSRTDTWSAETLRQLEGRADSKEQGPNAATDGKAGQCTETEALTVDVDRILKRIADLEAELRAAHEMTAGLEARNDSVQADRDRQAQRIQALEAENARLFEHRSLAQEMAERLERKLREELQQSTGQLETLRSARAVERAKVDEERRNQEHRIGEMAAEHAALQGSNLSLQEQLHASSALASERAEALAELEKSLGNEKLITGQLTRQFAAKLTECDKLKSLLDLRQHAIQEITCDRDELTERLQEQMTAHAELADQLAVAQQRLDENRALLIERDGDVVERDERLAQFATAIHDLGESVEAAQRETSAVRDELSVATQLQREQEQHRRELIASLEQAQQRIVDLDNQRAAADAHIQALIEERDGLLPLSEQLAARTAELEQSGVEQTRLRESLAAAHCAAHESAQLLNERTDELANLQRRAREHATAIRGLEVAIRARDELVTQLDGQLQTAQEERAIMADQVSKARKRVKSLTQEIFDRDHRIAELSTDLAVHTEALAAIRRDVERIGKGAAEGDSPNESEWILEPVEHSGAPIPLTAKMLTLGRTNENDVWLPSKLVSRHHARLLVGPTGVIVEDAGSTNGCYVNGEPVKQHLMHEGDVLSMGDLRYLLRARSAQDTKVRANVVPIFEGRPSN